MNDPVLIRSLATGVPGMDSLLGGGMPEFSFNIIADPPGSGKTTLAHPIMFARAGAGADSHPMYFTVPDQATRTMLRYQQQFPFFDIDKVKDEVRDFSPRRVFVDAIRALRLYDIGEEGIRIGDALQYAVTLSGHPSFSAGDHRIEINNGKQ